MNDTNNSKLADLNDLSVLNVKGFCWTGPQYDDLQEQTHQFLQGLVDSLPAIEGQQIIDLFQNEFFTNPTHFDFNSLSEEQKTYISIINFTFIYLHTIATTCSRWFKATNKIFSGDLRDWRRPLGNNDNISVTIKEIDDEDVVDNDEGIVDENIEIVDECDEESEDDTLDEDRFRINSIPGLYTRPLFWHSTTPPLRKVFDHLSQIKRSFHFFLKFFYNTFGSISHLHFDYITYNSIFESVAQNDYKLFCAIIYNWDDSLVSHLSIMVELAYPTFYYIESQIAEYDLTLERYKNELTANDHQYTGSPLTLIVSLYSIYIFRNILEKYLNDFERIMPYASFCFYKKSFVSFFFDWINTETEAISDFFRNHPDNHLPPETVSESPSDKKTSMNNEGNIVDGQVQQTQKQGTSSGDGNGGQPVETPKQPEDPKPEPIEKPFIKVPCGQRMLDKLINGLINGHEDDTLGKFIPLVSSKKGENNESIKKKLICLFSGEGINDESIKWPYDLNWNDNANSLKLLVYLLHHELLTEPLEEAIDENDIEGINQKIRTNFRGKKVWPIVGTALGYGRDYLRSKVKIPKESNISLMKKLAQFWYDCKILDD